MTKLFRHWWLVGLVGLVLGIPVGIALEFARRASHEAAIEAVTREFESKGTSPPLLIDFQQPWVVPISTAIGFVLVALVIYVIVNSVRRASQPARL